MSPLLWCCLALACISQGERAQRALTCREWCADRDRDGHGAIDERVLSCQEPDSFILRCDDCDDQVVGRACADQDTSSETGTSP